jgi:tol-pal system protein YbgF
MMAKSKAGQSQNMAKLRFDNGFGCLPAAALMVLLAWAAPALAQSGNEKAAKGAPTGAAAAPAADAGLKARVETLEEQLVDMQVVVGTLESLGKNGGSAPTAFPAASGGADAARIDGLETQVRALTAELQQLSDQVRSLGGNPRRGDIPSNTNTAAMEPGPDSGMDHGGSAGGGFGATTVSPGSGGDAIGGLLNGDAPPPAAAQAAPVGGPPGGMSASPGMTPASVATAALPLPLDSTNPKQLYETAYGYLLQRDYGAAQAAFDDFLAKYPNDSLSGNAQYWLGETHFVRGQYKAAAGAFLKGYQTYAQSAKAPDSLLKLAMSLDRLGQKDAACSSYAELSSKFPNAPQSVKSRAQSERQRVGCQ